MCKWKVGRKRGRVWPDEFDDLMNLTGYTLQVSQVRFARIDGCRIGLTRKRSPCKNSLSPNLPTTDRNIFFWFRAPFVPPKPETRWLGKSFTMVPKTLSCFAYLFKTSTLSSCNASKWPIASPGPRIRVHGARQYHRWYLFIIFWAWSDKNR